jgi:8-oxo-dGTP diphosphatase
MVFESIPEGFNPVFHLVTCYIEHGGKFLAVQRNNDKREGGKWGVPGGKVEQDETEAEALARELDEEIALKVLPDKLRYLKKVFVRFPDVDFEATMFSLKLDVPHDVILGTDEHQAYQWVTLDEALKMDLIRHNEQYLKIMVEEAAK